MASLLEMSFFGSTIYQYFQFLAVLIGAFVAGKVLKLILSFFSKAVFAKTKTEYDDQLIESIKDPLMMLVVIGGFYLAFSFLTIQDTLLGTVFGALWILVVIALTWVVTRMATVILQYAVFPISTRGKFEFYHQMFPTINSVITAAIVVVAIIMVLDNFGYDVTTLIAGFGVLGVAVGFAAREVIADMFGGLSIFSSQAFKVGDRIKVAGMEGVVKSINLRTTRLTDNDGNRIIIPNNTVAHSVVVRFPRPPRKKK